MTSTSQAAMPKFSLEYQYPKKTIEIDSIIMVVRFYAPFGNGAPKGWQKTVELPVITVDGKVIQQNQLTLIFSNDKTANNPGGYPRINYIDGQQDGGFDQHTQYYWGGPGLTHSNQLVTISGQYQLTGYFSIIFYYRHGETFIKQFEFIDKDIPCLSPGNNPYRSGNPSVFAYQPSGLANASNGNNRPGKKPSVLKIAFNSLFGGRRQTKKETAKRTPQISNSVALYRPDIVSSKVRMLEGTVNGECSTDYLSTEENADMPYDVLMLRIKVPNVFIQNENPPEVFGVYQCRYVSVSSNISEDDVPILPFWTVTGRMMEEYKDENGYAYVFFMPTEDVEDLVDLQKPPNKTPPIVEWGGFKGYVLGPPKFSVILRYRDPNPDWIGSPGKANCFIDDAQNQPIEQGELGEYTPEIYGDSLANFEKGKIGPVDNDKPWPGKKV